jgi:hypothetical protein
LGAVILAVFLLWGLRLAGVISNGPFAWAVLAIVIVCSIVPYALDRRRGDAPAAFGMPTLVQSRHAGSGLTDALEPQELTAKAEQVSTTAGTGPHGA